MEFVAGKAKRAASVRVHIIFCLLRLTHSLTEVSTMAGAGVRSVCTVFMCIHDVYVILKLDL